MHRRALGNTPLDVTPIGLGTVKIGRNQGVKYPRHYALPTAAQASHLLNHALDLGINLIDTAPAYGLSEARIGQAISHRREEFVLSTKVGETFADGESSFDFTAEALGQSIERSLSLLRTDVLDIVLVHSDGNDEHILNHTDAAPTLLALRDRGLIRAVGLSGKTEAGFRSAFEWADLVMVEYSQSAPQLAPIITEAYDRGVGVLVKKGLGSGQLSPARAIRFVLDHPGATSLIVGGLNGDHLRANIEAARGTG